MRERRNDSYAIDLCRGAAHSFHRHEYVFGLHSPADGSPPFLGARSTSDAVKVLGSPVVHSGLRCVDERTPTLRSFSSEPRGSVREERANFKGLVLGCVEADFCN